MPSAYDALGGRLVQDAGFKAVYVGGFVTGGSRCTSEPLLTMDEQVRVAGDVANAVSIPTIADGGAGFGEPLHTMRTVREFIRAGVAGIHIEDQLYPKRAHYHKYVAHAIPRDEFIDKIKFACHARDEDDKDFVIIARTDTCRFEGLEEAMTRINMAADVGADMGLYFPRNLDEMKARPESSSIPLVYVISRRNRDNRPLPSASQLDDMGYKAASMRSPICWSASTLLRVPSGNPSNRQLHGHEPRKTSMPGSRSRTSSASINSTKSRKKPSKTRSGANARSTGSRSTRAGF